MFKKVISLIVSCSLLLTQPIFAQGVAELNIGKYLSQMPALNTDSFRPPHLRYISYDIKSNDFKLLLDQGDFEKSLGHQVTKSPEKPENILKNETQNLFNYFLIGLSLPNEKFWVNLRPDAPEQIIDPELEKTDMGKIMLEADLELKKDTASLTSPQNPEGREYWDKLYRKAGELFGTENITIPTITRPWIVPGEVIIRESEDSSYIYKANLKVMLEEDYLKNPQPSQPNYQPLTSNYSFSDPRMKELNKYSTQLIRELILPKLTQEINTSKKYAQLRQVFFSLILSRWFKDKYGPGSPVSGLQSSGQNGDYVKRIDSGDLTDLVSKESWSKDYYFKEYQKSFQEGEYHLKEQITTPTGQVIRNYVSGGADMTGNLRPLIKGSFKGGLKRKFLSLLAGMFFLIPMQNNIAEAFSPYNPPNSIYDDPKDGTFDIVMKAIARDIVFEDDEKTLEKIYQRLTVMPFSFTGVNHMIILILSNLNNDYAKETEEAYRVIDFLLVLPGYGPGEDGINEFFHLIDVRYKGMNSASLPVKPAVYTLNILSQFLKELFPLPHASHPKYESIEKRNDQWHNRALKYLNSYRQAKGGQVSNKDPIYKAIINLLRITSTLGIEKGSSPLTPAVVLEDEFKKVKDYAFNKFKSLEEFLMPPKKGTALERMMAARPNLRLKGGPFTNNINQSKGFPGLMMSIESALQSAPRLFSGQVNLKQLGEIRQGLVDVIKPMGIQLQFELFEYINEYVLKNPAAASKLKAILQRPELNERIFDRLSPLKKNEVIAAVTEDVIKAVDRQKASDFFKRAEAWKALSEFMESSSALTQDLPQNTDLPLMPGGIDFRKIEYLTQPMGSFQGLDLRLPLLSKAELEGIDIGQELASIEVMVNAKIDVSTDRLKCLLAAMSQKDVFSAQREIQLLPLLLRLCWLKEERGVETTPDFRAVLLIADTGLFVEQGNTKYSLN